jgi:single-stranded-DNA-specific exonuclease
MATRREWNYRELPSSFEGAAQQLGLPGLLVSLLAARGISEVEQVEAFLSSTHYHPLLKFPGLEEALTRLRAARQSSEMIYLLGSTSLAGQVATEMLSDGLTKAGFSVTRLAGDPPSPLQGAGLYVRVSLFYDDDYTQYTNNTEGITLFGKHESSITLKAPWSQPKTANRIPPVVLAYLLIHELSESDARLDFIPFGMGSSTLQGDNRYWMQRGLEALRKTKSKGILALLHTTQLNPEHLSGDDLRNTLIPRLEAAGSAHILSASTEAEATRVASEIEANYQKTRLLVRQHVDAARETLAQDPSLLSWNAIVLSDSGIPADAVKEVLRQLVEEYERPVVLLTTQEEIVQGKIRNSEGWNLCAALDTIQNLLVGSSCDDYKASFEILPDNVPMLRRRLSNALSKTTESSKTLTIDAELPFDQITLDFVQQLERLAPFGIGNPRPVFAAHNIKRIRSAKAGSEGEHRRLTLRDANGFEQSVMLWESETNPLPEGVFSLAYRVRPVFRDGSYEIRVSLVDWLQTEAPEEALEKPEIIDCRAQFDLEAIQSQESSLAIWAEGFSAKDSPGLTLSALDAAEALVVYTAPPNPDALLKAVDSVTPRRVYIVAQLPPFDAPARLLEALTALLKTAQEQFSGQIKLGQLAERTAHSIPTIRLALEVLSQSCEFEWVTKSTLKVISVGSPPKNLPAEYLQAIEETAAYRRYFRRASLEALLP